MTTGRINQISSVLSRDRHTPSSREREKGEAARNPPRRARARQSTE